MNNSNDANIFCPLENDTVDVCGYCEHCELWDGRKCCFIDVHVKARKPEGFFRSFLKRLRRPGRRFRKGGRGLSLPPVWEEWPDIKFEAEEQPAPGNGIEYGTAECSEPELFQVKDKKKKEKYVLPELRKEYWDIEPDMPDWVPEPDSPVAGEPGPVPDMLLDDPQSEPFPPDIGPDSGMGNPLDEFPGFPQDIDGLGSP